MTPTPAPTPTPTPVASLSDRHPRLPADRFYWAILAIDLPRRSLTPATHSLLDEAFAAHVPASMERVATAYAWLPSDKVLACGLPVSELEREPLSRAITIAPESLPAWLDEHAEPESLNVLVGRFEPEPVTQASRRKSALAAAMVAAVAMLAWVGFERRVSAARLDRTDATAAIEQLSASPVANTIGVAPQLRSGDHEAASITLDKELSRLVATRNGRASIGLADAASPLASLLARWPRDLSTQLQSISSAQDKLSLSVQLPSLPDAEKLAAALSGTPGWESSQPQISARGSGVQMQFTLKAGGKP